MALNAGNADCTTGLSQRVYDYLIADARNGFVSPLTPAAADCVRALCWAVARGVVDELVANAEVEVTITTSDGGLQTSTAVGTPTDPPASPGILGGTVS